MTKSGMVALSQSRKTRLFSTNFFYEAACWFPSFKILKYCTCYSTTFAFYDYDTTNIIFKIIANILAISVLYFVLSSLYTIRSSFQLIAILYNQWSIKQLENSIKWSHFNRSNYNDQYKVVFGSNIDIIRIIK